MSYNEPEYKAGFTDAEGEKYGDAVLMTWRDWVALRELMAERKEEIEKEWTDDPVEHGQLGILNWMMQTMDETLP